VSDTATRRGARRRFTASPKVCIPASMSIQQAAGLHRLAEQEAVPLVVLIREAVDLLLREREALSRQ